MDLWLCAGGIHGAQWGVWNMEKKAEQEEQEGSFILKEEFVCPKELSFRIKAVLLSCLQKGCCPAQGRKDTVVSLKLNLPCPYIKNISL